MARFCANLGLPQRIQPLATMIAKRATENDVVAGRATTSVAAAAIFLACLASGETKTAKEIGEITGVAESTIKQTYRHLQPWAATLFPDGYKPAVAFNALPKA